VKHTNPNPRDLFSGGRDPITCGRRGGGRRQWLQTVRHRPIPDYRRRGGEKQNPVTCHTRTRARTHTHTHTHSDNHTRTYTDKHTHTYTQSRAHTHAHTPGDKIHESDEGAGDG